MYRNCTITQFREETTEKSNVEEATQAQGRNERELAKSTAATEDG